MIQRWQQAAVVRGLPGLLIAHHGFNVDHEFFACCEARGLRLIEDQSMARCSLSRRVQRVHSISRNWLRYWGDQGLSIQSLTKLVDDPQALELRDLAFQFLTEGDSVVQGRWTAKSMDPSMWWAVALKMGWIEGLSVAVHRFDRRCPDSPLGFHQQGMGPQPDLWVLEGVNQLWDPAHAERLERWLTWADDHQQRLWLDLNPPEPKKTSQKTNPFAAKIAAAKETRMFDELSPRCRDLLRSAKLDHPLRPSPHNQRASRRDKRP